MRTTVKFQTSEPRERGASGNQPQGVVIELQDWGLGGVRQRVEITLWEALELRKALDELFGGAPE